MGFITPVLFSPFVVTPTITTVMTSVITEFFTKVFLNPGNHLVAVIVMSAVVVAICVGIIFLIKLLFDKCCPVKPDESKSDDCSCIKARCKCLS